VDAARIGAHGLSLLVDSVWSNDATRTSHDVVIVPAAAAGQFTVHVGATAVPVAVNAGRRWRRKDGAEAGSGPQRLSAPMPGKIVRVLVAEGDAVRARQPLVVVEAMKMENEVRAAREGVVAEIHVRAGMSVDAGAPLIVIR